MAAPSGIEWGSIYGSGTHRGRLGCYKSVSTSGSSVSVNVQIWFWSEYDCYDENNTFYCDVGQNITEASTSQGSVSLSCSATSQWSTSNQKKVFDKTYSYTAGTAARTYKVYAKLASIEYIGKTLYINDTFNVPALTSYTVKYNANGGSGAPSSQTKWYGKALTLSSTKPTRTGYTFQGWGTSDSDTSVDYAAGASYTANKGITLYAIWKANTFTVTYNANGGTGAPASQTKTYGVALTLRTATPTRTNYTFKGWGTSATATTVAYAAGASYTKNASITLYAIWSSAYTKPKIKSFTVGRCDADGTANVEGAYALVKFRWATSVAVSSAKIKWKSTKATTYSEPVAADVSGTSGIVEQIVGGDFDSETTYTIRVDVVDSVDSNFATRTLPGTLFPVDVLYNGKGVGIGKAAEIEDFLDVAFNARFRKNVYTGEKQANGDGKQGVLLDDEGFIHLQRETAKGYYPYLAFYLDDETAAAGTIALELASDGTRQLKLKNADDMVLSPALGGEFRPYFRAGDSITISAMACSGYTTNYSKDIYFLIPFAKPVVGSPAVAIAAGMGLRLRQNGNYTHGSTSAAVTPDSFTVSKYYNFGIQVKATFSDVTNAVNNAPIGVAFTGTITFS